MVCIVHALSIVLVGWLVEKLSCMSSSTHLDGS